ncbi:MAG TPA: methyltransferase [Acidobacteriota bacterium]|jgi:SAM-dependent methyltransferase|nr:methyltransferase [Acidobacteriota bacterium]HNT17807.1 methyltransferase [Acidobacteriota bacterium]HPA27493.1 methyltransferase [Acidobacteriota bacterium]HQO20672.1 methyltransferase [Acidobacteriota bacterium]HQQ47990.1 methyltransferase [Acidobacteriota bacterium]
MEKWDPKKLLEVSGGYWASFALHAGVELDVFTLLDGESLTRAEVSKELTLSGRGAEAILNALAAMGLLAKKDGRFQTAEDAARYLSRSSKEYIGYMIRHHHYISKGWAELPECVRTGVPARDPGHRRAGERELEAFEMGMFNNASPIAPKVAEVLPLPEKGSLLDLGGGPGTYAIHFCLRHPGLMATVFDLSQVRPFAEKTIGDFGLGARIAFAEGDFNEDPLPAGFDAVWLSHILHGEGPSAASRLVAKASASLKDGGVMLIHEFILDDRGDSPLHPALFSLNMLVGTAEGKSYTGKEIEGFMRDAGISGISLLDSIALPNSRIMAGRKEAP